MPEIPLGLECDDLIILQLLSNSLFMAMFNSLFYGEMKRLHAIYNCALKKNENQSVLIIFKNRRRSKTINSLIHSSILTKVFQKSWCVSVLLYSRRS